MSNEKTFKEVADELPIQYKTKHQEQLLTNYIIPYFGINKIISTISQDDIVKFLWDAAYWYERDYSAIQGVIFNVFWYAKKGKILEYKSFLRD